MRAFWASVVLILGLSGALVWGSSVTTNFWTYNGTAVSPNPITANVNVGTTITMNASTGNIVTAGSLVTGSGGSTAGALDLGQGTLPALATNSVSFFAPASVTSYGLLYPGAAPGANQILVWGAPSSGVSTGSFTSSPTFTFPILGTATATSLNKVAFTAPTTAATIVFSADNETVTLPNGTVAANDFSNITTIVHDLVFTDATYDIGKTGATRPRDIFASRNGNFGGTLTVTGSPTFNNRMVISVPPGADIFQIDGTNGNGYVGLNSDQAFYFRSTQAATSGSQTRNSISIYLRGAYWNGSASVNMDALVKLKPSTTPASSRLTLGFATGGGEDIFNIFQSGGVALGSTTDPGINNLNIAGTIQGGGYKSSDGTAGFTGTCTIAGLIAITVKNGLVTACS